MISSWRKIMALSAFFLGAYLVASEWMWHGSFPWVYSHETEEWIYWRAGKGWKVLSMEPIRGRLADLQ